MPPIRGAKATSNPATTFTAPTPSMNVCGAMPSVSRRESDHLRQYVKVQLVGAGNHRRDDECDVQDLIRLIDGCAARERMWLRSP